MSLQAKSLWQHDGRFGAMVDVDNELWVQWRGEGLKRRVGDHFEMLPGGERYAATLIYNLLPMPDGRVLLRSLDPYFSIWKDGAFTDRPLLNAHPDTRQFGTALVMDSAHVAFAGDDGVLRIVDVDAQTLRRVPVGKSFISQVARDVDGALLVVSDEGVARMQWPARWQLYDDRYGLRGAVHAIRLIDNTLYLLTGAGIYEAAVIDNQLMLPFVSRQWTENESWDLLRIDGDLLLAEGQTLFRIRSGTAEPIVADGLYPRRLLASVDEPGLLWVGTEQGVALLRHESDRWHLLARAGELGMRTASLVRRDAQSVWLGTDDGLMVATWDPRATPPLTVVPAAEGGDAGVPLGGRAEVSATSDGILVSSADGLFRENDGRWTADPMNGLDALPAADELLSFEDGIDGDLWASSYRALYRRQAGHWTVANLDGLGLGTFDARLLLPNGDVLLGGAGVLLRASGSSKTSADGGFRPQIIRVQLDPQRRGEDPRDLPIEHGFTVPSGAGAISVQFALPDLTQSASPQFRVRLRGLDDDWSEWAERAVVSYAALPPGDYALEYEARRANGVSQHGEPLDISVTPRWFERSDVRVAGLIALLLAALLILHTRHRHRLERLSAHNRELDQQVRMRTAELESANARLRPLVERDGLTGVSNRRHFDASLAAALDQAQSSGAPLSLLMIDVDHFKRYNDTNGHQAGDDALCAIARVIAAALRSDDSSLARYGGEEFAVIARSCTADGATTLAQRLRAAIQADPVTLTISIGIAAYDPARDVAPADLIERADKALYQAKREGRDRIVVAD